jgi:hypothetical protein
MVVVVVVVLLVVYGTDIDLVVEETNAAVSRRRSVAPKRNFRLPTGGTNSDRDTLLTAKRTIQAPRVEGVMFHRRNNER